MMGNKNKKTILLGSLLILILGVSIGFAAYQTVLTVNSSALINPDSSTFKVFFSSDPDKLMTDEIVPTVSNTNITYTKGVINNNDIYPTISDLSAIFTEPGQKVEYNFYVRNDGEYEAYLNSIVLDGNSFKSCIGSEGTSNDLVSRACNGIIFTIKVGNTTTTTTTANISNNSIMPGTSQTVTVTVEYNSGSARADGPFEVYFGDVYLTYGSAKTTDEIPDFPEQPCIVENGTGTSIGDQIACGNERFRVIDSDANAGTVTMITAQNITLSITPIQSGDAGTIAFADSIYWNATGYVYNSNSKLYSYVEAYETQLQSMGVSSANATLINEEQFQKLGCSLNESGGTDSCPSSVSWIYSTKYWTGFSSNSNIFFVNNNYDAGLGNGVYNCYDVNGNDDCAIEYIYGIRPVVTIAKTQLKKA